MNHCLVSVLSKRDTLLAGIKKVQDEINKCSDTELDKRLLLILTEEKVLLMEELKNLKAGLSFVDTNVQCL
jgi:hypothetical protein